MSNVVYQAAVYAREITYMNLNGEKKTIELKFSIDPIKLMRVISTVQLKAIKSGNPALRGKTEDITDEQQIKLIQDLACQSAGSPSMDGERWIPFRDFEEDVAGQAFLTKLMASDADRKEFSETVLLKPFRAFVEYAKDDPSNSPADIQNIEKTMAQMERVFSFENKDAGLSIEEKRAKLAAEMAALDASFEIPTNEA